MIVNPTNPKNSKYIISNIAVSIISTTSVLTEKSVYYVGGNTFCLTQFPMTNIYTNFVKKQANKQKFLKIKKNHLKNFKTFDNLYLINREILV